MWSNYTTTVMAPSWYFDQFPTTLVVEADCGWTAAGPEGLIPRVDEVLYVCIKHNTDKLTSALTTG
jgi:hypothetical protein